MSDPVTEPPASTPNRTEGGATVATRSRPATSGDGPAPQEPARAGQGHRRKARHARVVVRKVGPWSVLKISFLFYMCVMAVIMGALVILYGLLGAIGALGSLRSLIQDLFYPGLSFQIDGGWLFTRGLAIGLGMVVVWTLINVFVAFLYNLLADVVGGIEITLSERR